MSTSLPQKFPAAPPPEFLSPNGLRWVLPDMLLVGPGMEAHYYKDPVAWLHVGTASTTYPPRRTTQQCVPIEDCVPAPDGMLEFVIREYKSARAAFTPMLITCDAGISRSVSFCYGILRVVHFYPHESALRLSAAGTMLGIDPVENPEGWFSPRGEPFSSVRRQAEILISENRS